MARPTNCPLGSTATRSPAASGERGEQLARGVGFRLGRPEAFGDDRELPRLDRGRTAAEATAR